MDFSSLSLADIYTELKTTKDGLTSTQVDIQKSKYGTNTMTEKKEWIVFKRFIKAWNDPLSLILLGAAGISYLTGEMVDALIIFIIVCSSTLLNFFQQEKAEKAASKLQDRLKHTCKVLRDGVVQEIKSSEVVLGDILVVTAGNLVPADARIIESTDCFVNQSALTGESFPQEKKVYEYALSAQDTVPDEHHMLFAGTSLVSGMAKAIVIATGKQTKLGQIAHALVTPSKRSSFEEGIHTFSMTLTKTTMLFVFIVFIGSLLQKQTLFHAFMFAIAIGVGLTPELLPMILTLTMGTGSYHMAKKGVIMKHLSSIPTLGSMDILCTDKTGTLTEDKIALVKYLDYSEKENPLLLTYAYISSTFQQSIKNPLDTAISEYKKVSTTGFEKQGELPFDFSRRRMSVLTSTPQTSSSLLITKGAPEEILTQCTTVQMGEQVSPYTEETKQHIIEQYHQLSDEGYRVLALGFRNMEKNTTLLSHKDEDQLTFLGLLAFLDPPKQDVAETIVALRNAGVGLKIITGDNERVTKRICAQLNIPVEQVLMGYDLTTMTDDALRIRAENTTIFARCSPDQKNRIIGALRDRGHTVGYMGDGINDAPSLHHADVGISVENAVDVAKDTAPIILTEKNLKVLLDGILEGRRTFANSMKYLMMGVSSNFGNMFSVLVSLIMVPFLPLLPIQILLNNLLYDVSQMTIPKDHVDTELLQKPQRWDHTFIKTFMFTFGGISSLFDILGFILFFFIFQSSPEVFRTAWFLQSLTTQTLIIHIVRTQHIPFIQSTPHPWVLISSLLITIIGWIIPYSPLAHWFGFVALPLPLLIGVIIIILGYLCTVEGAKHIFYRFFGSNVKETLS